MRCSTDSLLFSQSTCLHLKARTSLALRPRLSARIAIERSGSWRAGYHVLHGKLSPLNGVGPEDLNLASLISRVESGEVDELVLALSNDVEGEATCHFLHEQVAQKGSAKVTRIGFGIPSGGGVLYADSVTLKSALDGRRAVS